MDPPVAHRALVHKTFLHFASQATALRTRRSVFGIPGWSRQGLGRIQIAAVGKDVLIRLSTQRCRESLEPLERYSDYSLSHVRTAQASAHFFR